MNLSNRNKLEIIIPINAVTKKNHSNVIMIKGRPIVLPSKQYREFEKEVIKLTEIHFGNLEPIDYPINLKAIFYRDKNYRSDLVGYEQALCDALVKSGLLLDDNHNIVKSMDGSRVETDKDYPRIEITIERYKDDSN